MARRSTSSSLSVYTQGEMFTRRTLLGILLLSVPLHGQQPKEQKAVEPPEEDESQKPKVYDFNPLQASKELKIGQYYFKKGSFKAALRRFEEATKWDPTSAEAFLHLGETREKVKDTAGAKDAYAKYLELAPDSKLGPSLKKKFNLK